MINKQFHIIPPIKKCRIGHSLIIRWEDACIQETLIIRSQNLNLKTERSLYQASANLSSTGIKLNHSYMDHFFRRLRSRLHQFLALTLKPPLIRLRLLKTGKRLYQLRRSINHHLNAVHSWRTEASAKTQRENMALIYLNETLLVLVLSLL